MERGQVSIETLLISLFILIMSISVLSYFFSINDSTLAIELVKVHALNEMGKLDSFASIESVGYSVSGSEITLDLATDPEVDCSELPMDEAKTTIAERTNFENVKINLNGDSC